MLQYCHPIIHGGYHAIAQSCAAHRNLGRDAEARFTAKGTKYATFSLAVNRTWKSAAGEKHEPTDWFLVNAWGKLGDFAAQYLKKGRLV